MADSDDYVAMPDAHDAEDAQLLAAGDLAALLARYEPVIRGRCIARLRGGPDAEDVAQNVMLRLIDEFNRGRDYGGLPYRVVVHKVIDWTIGDYFTGRPMDALLPEGWELAASDDLEAEIAGRDWVEWVVSHVDGNDGEVIRLRYRDGLESSEIAERLGMRPNAVYQANFRAIARLREVLDAA